MKWLMEKLKKIVVMNGLSMCDDYYDRIVLYDWKLNSIKLKA